MSLELAGAEASRRTSTRRAPEHPSLLDPTHQMDALFGVVNIPNVIWIDEDGRDRPAARTGLAGPAAPSIRRTCSPRDARNAVVPRNGAEAARGRAEPIGAASLPAGQDRDAVRRRHPRLGRQGRGQPVRDDARRGGRRVAATLDRACRKAPPASSSPTTCGAPASRDAAIAQFNECHRLQPDNWTYKRQAWSLVGNERRRRRARPVHPGARRRRGGRLAVRVGLPLRRRKRRSRRLLPEDHLRSGDGQVPQNVW